MKYKLNYDTMIVFNCDNLANDSPYGIKLNKIKNVVFRRL